MLTESENVLTISAAEAEADLKAVSNFKTKNEKLAFNRRQKKIEDLVQELEPLNDSLMKIQADRQKIIDVITELRQQLIKECVHPKNSLIHKDTFIECKFCNAKISIPKKS